jgi:2-dehydro-3-deoxyphosphogluconate aldolase / (4S)-4-hydroxy-2-oxoglutarate aldolase
MTVHPNIAKHDLALRILLSRVTVVPVLTIEPGTDAVGLARALVAGGLDVLEVTLRTPEALAAIREIAAAVPEAIVGAGTILDPEQGAAAIRAGARFLVSPGITPRLAAAAHVWSVPFLPGVATASEAMALRDLGMTTLTFFPAEQAGGAAAMKALDAPLGDLMFCPTGGIDAAKAPAYLALPNVLAVGGSWVAPAGAVKGGDWAAVTALATAAGGIKRSPSG